MTRFDNPRWMEGRGEGGLRTTRTTEAERERRGQTKEDGGGILIETRTKASGRTEGRV